MAKFVEIAKNGFFFEMFVFLVLTISFDWLEYFE
jgi:hypothetical protein